ncbi:hypothetical protein MNBD_ACTINO01-548 [hydrothermal vent metagenome]|uniref:HNH nuclease domain-containing protein n=1 Tax=hydrothermal vent metagenome TaxID=652676 RepID=A0A3B0RQM2_9ZZZZ
MLDDKPRLRAGEIRFGEEHLYEVIEPVIRIYDQVPPGLGAVAPGPVLAGWLSSIDVSSISPHDRIVVLQAHDRLVSHFQAQRYRDMVAVADAEADEWGDRGGLCHDADEAGGVEVGAALTLTRRGADIEMTMALSLFRRLPRLAGMLEAGIIDVARVRVIERATGHLSDTGARGVVDAVADVASTLTTGELGAQIRRLCIESDPDDARDRYETAVDGRRVVMTPTDDGAANLSGFDLVPDRAQAAMGRINTIARAMRGDGETRSMDQLRADIYLDLLNGVEHHTARPSVIDLTVSKETLTRDNDQPGHLGGYGPVIADVARRIATSYTGTECRITLTHGNSNVEDGVTAVDTTRRYPTTAQRRRIETRDRVCVFPGCRIPAINCDIDHIVAVANGGTTTDDNLAPLCRYHHRIKHEHGWTYQRTTHGRYEWTSPTGHTYTKTRPP